MITSPPNDRGSLHGDISKSYFFPLTFPWRSSVSPPNERKEAILDDPRFAAGEVLARLFDFQFGSRAAHAFNVVAGVRCREKFGAQFGCRRTILFG